MAYVHSNIQHYYRRVLLNYADNNYILLLTRYLKFELCAFNSQ